MTAQFLLIQNHGEAPVAGYTVLGYSSTRNCGTEGVIGMFGSGTKNAINLCLRNGLPVWVYCGKTRLEFGVEKEIINDGLRDDTIYHVVYRNNNAKFQRIGWSLDMGLLDWSDLGMALREFISNALDRTIREEGDIREARNAGRLSIKIIDDKDRRAKADFTRVYVALSDGVREYYGRLGKKFLHFSDNPKDATPGILEKANRNVDGKGAVIYREGVLVRELDGVSNFDYNFSRDQIKLDECRNSNEYYIRAACAKMVKDAEPKTLATLMKSQLDGKETFESGFDSDYLTDFGCPTESQAARWQEAWAAAAGADTVICDSEFSKNYAEKKGHPAKQVQSTSWSSAIRRAGIKSAYDVLSIDEQRGRTRVDTTVFAQAAVEWAWTLCELVDLVGGREKPEVFCFQQVGESESQTNGYCDSEGVHVHVDIANDGINNELKKTALEEVVHWVTGATDNSRDFQSFLIDLIVGVSP